VGVGSEPGVIREIPARVIWVVVYYDVVAVPEPIAGVVKVVRSHAPEEAAKPETVPASAFEAINVIAANFAAEVSVFPNVVLVVTCIVASSVMTDPLIVLSMHVRGFGMALLVAIRCPPLVAARTIPAFVAALCLNLATRTTAATSVAALWLSSAAVRGWAVSGYVTAAHLRAAAGTATAPLTATSAAALTAASTPVLGKRRKRQNQKNCKQTR
jgi:hypothetical protein